MKINFREMETEHLLLIEAFINKYRLCRRIMEYQQQYEEKSKLFEKELGDEYEWMITRESAQKSILSQVGLFDAIQEIEKFMVRWKYNTKDTVIYEQ